MIFLYNLIIPLIALLALPFISIAFAMQPKLQAGFYKKIGKYEFKKNKQETVIFHAVSVGEVNAIEQLIIKTREKHPDINIILTTTTKTGQDVANKKLSKYVTQITYFPYDFIFSVKSFLNTYKPSKVIIAETEIWPCFSSTAKKMGIKTYIINGRISPNSYIGYKKFSYFFKSILSNYEAILMQSESDANRIIDIGANPDKTKIMGNLKFDICPTLTKLQINNLKKEMKLGDNRLLIAASTHNGEDEIILNVYKKLKGKFDDLKLLIAPRHPHRYSQVEDLIKSYNFKFGRRTDKDTFDDNDIIMLDTMGELSNFYSIGYLAFIGGSFSQTGGHNPLEANIWSKPVISGPAVFNFRDIYSIVVNENAAKIVNTQEELLEKLSEYLFDKDKYEKACISANKIFEANQGAVDFVLKNIL